MAEETAVRFRIETVGADRLDSESEKAVASVERLAAAEAKLNREAKPAATSVSKLAQEESKTGAAADSASPRVDKLGDEIQQTGRQAATAGGQLDKTGAQMRGLGSFAGQMATKVVAAASAFLSFQVVKEILGDAITAIKEDEAATALLEARIRSTGGAAERSLEQLDALAGSLSRATGIDDEGIKQAEIELQQFDRVYGDVFDRAVRLAADLGAVSGDVAGEITLLGKALQDPEEGIAGLEKNIGRLTDSQSDLIIKTAKLGDVQEAQQMLLDVVERRVGGTAEAYRDTLGGALRAATTEWENQLELLRTGLSPAIRQVAEDFVHWSQTAQGQEQIVAIGRQLGDIIAKIGTSLRDLDTDEMAQVLSLTLDLASGLASVVDLLDTIGHWTPSGLIFDGLINGASALKREVESAWEIMRQMPQRLDPRAMAGAAAGLMAPQPGMTDAQRKAWDEAEAGAQRDHQRAQERQADLARTAALEAKRLQSAREAAAKLVEGIEQEATARRESLAILKQEGVSQQDLIKRYRESEIAQKADAKVAEIRAAYLRAGKTLTDENAKAIRGWVTEAENAADAASKWMSNLAPTSLPLIEIEVKPKLVGLELVQDEMEWVIGQLGTIEDIRLSNQASIDAHNQAIYDDLLDQALHFKESLTTPKQALMDFQARIDELARVVDDAGNTVLSAAEAERLRSEAVATYTMQQLDQQMAAWGGFFSYLGSAFGGVVQQIASAIQRIQGGISTGRGMGQAMGGTANAAAAGGAAGAFVAVVVEVYKWMQSEAAKRKAESYGHGAVLVKGGPQEDWSIAVQDEARRASLQIQNTLEALAEAIGGTIETFAALEVQVRRDGEWFHTFVSGRFVGYFKDMQSAVEAGIMAGLKDPATTFSGLSDLVREALDYAFSDGTVKIGGLEELQDFMGKIKEISDIRLGPTADVLGAIRHVDQLWVAIGRLPEATEAAIQGMSDLSQLEASVWQNLFDSITGRQKSEAEIRAEKERDLKVAKAELEIRKAQIAQRIIQAQAELAALKAGNLLIGGGGGTNGVSGGKGKGGIAGLAFAFASAGVVIAQTTSLVTGAATGMVGALEAEIKGLEDLLRALGEIVIPDIGAIGGGGRAGGGVDERQGVRDFIKDKRFELSLVGLSDYERALKELDRTYEPLLKSAGKDNALKAELIALREKERQLLEDQKRRDTAGKFDVFMGIGQDPFSQLRKGAADLIKEIEDSPFGDERKARMIGRILGELERQIERMSRQAAAGLLGEMLADMERFGATDAQMALARQQMAILEHTLKMEHYRTEIALLKAQGNLAPEVVAALDAAFNFLAGIDPTAFVGPRSPLTSAKGRTTFRGYDDEGTGSGARGLGDELRRAVDALKKFRDIVQEIADSNKELLLSEEFTTLSPEARRAEALRAYEDIYARAQSGDAEALKEYVRARQTLLEIERDYSKSGPAYAELLARVLREGAGLVLSPEVEQKSIAALLAEQVASEEETAAMIHADLLALRSSVIDGLAGLSGARGEANLLNGIPRFAAGSYASPFIPEGASSASQDNGAVRLLGVIASEVNLMRLGQETANQRLVRLENASQRTSSILETLARSA